ncbi:MAG: beta-aspartyl-peptidase [Peptococcaceae bacterium]|jgi:beta-aspartyl-dipeptidase (metallo-type)|nr:beta-aspartyl-peptidase [Peptococcaceae bacterium]MDH7526263.1 beta-aspartyl-peptidase [Peptococcaceae bacterium]
MFKLIKGGTLFSPDELGSMDVLIAGSQIVKISRDIKPPAGLETEVVDGQGKMVVPGFIDGHVHITGAGGSEGPFSRTQDVSLSTLARAGLTTVVGTLGIDRIGFSLRQLLVKARALEKEGVSTYIYTGAYQLPAATITDSVTSDLALIDKVIGVKIALFDPLSSHPDKETLIQLASQAWLGGRLGDKAGVVHIHLGETPGDLYTLINIATVMGVPLKMFVPTHVNRCPEVFEKTIDCAKKGMAVDITSLLNPSRGINKAIPPAKALKTLLEEGTPLENITMSSDSNATYPVKDENGILERMFLTPVDSIAEELRNAVLDEKIALTDFLKVVTINPAQRLRLDEKKGSIAEGKDADIVILDKDLKVDTVIARGRLLLKERVPVARGAFEDDYRKVMR